MRTHVNFARVNKLETPYGRSRLYVEVEPRSTFTSTFGLSYIASISFTRVKFACVRTKKLRDTGNQPQGRTQGLNVYVLNRLNRVRFSGSWVLIMVYVVV